jgi:two-component system, cell cycle sensor histidine kinase and response regulator CckA
MGGEERRDFQGLSLPHELSKQSADSRDKQLQSLGKLAGLAAREVHALGSGILGVAGLGRSSDEKSPAIQSILEQLDHLATRAADLGKQLALCAPRESAPREARDLNAVVREAIESVRLSERVSLVVELAEGLPLLPVDVASLRQAIANVLVNAAEAVGDRGGMIHVSTRLVQVDEEAASREALAVNLRPGEFVAVTVRDGGSGLSPEARERLFEPFFSTKLGRRGLGLAGVLGVVRGHQGAVCVESTATGTAFRLLLPIKRAAVSPRSVPVPEGWRGKGLVLVVDDEPSLCDVAARLLQAVGFQTALAYNGRQAIEEMRRADIAFRLVLLDLSMPDLDGEATFRALREIQSDVPVLLMSGHSEDEAMSSFEAHVHYLQKPFRLPTLVDAVRRCLGE